MFKKIVSDIVFENQPVLVRADFNVPIENGEILDLTRIQEAVQTVRYLLENGAKPILMTHLKRPGGKCVESLRLDIVTEKFQELIPEYSVTKLNESRGPAVQEALAKQQKGEVIVLENIRFEPGEKDGNEVFVEEISSYADIFVNEAFGTSHRKQSSMYSIPQHCHVRAAGFLVQKEIETMGRAMRNPERPLLVLAGGAKVSSKVDLIENFLDVADIICIGGAMAYTFLHAQGIAIGKSLLEEDMLPKAKQILETAKKKHIPIILPIDHIGSDQFKDGSIVNIDTPSIPDDLMALDIGPQTIALFKQKIESAKTILWNGPMGVFEQDAFAQGTFALARAIADSSAISIIGGGESAAAARKAGVEDQISHISTGGGASLQFLEGKPLPGIDVLDDPRPILVAGNWKMYKTLAEAETFTKAFQNQLTIPAHTQVMVLPSALYLDTFQKQLDSSILIGAQNVYPKDFGAYTGEISGAMLAAMNIRYALVGHSERRAYFHETDTIVNEKIKHLLRHDIQPIVCIGEQLEHRETGQTETILRQQLEQGLADLSPENMQRIILAYEPVWAIGTGKTATPEQANETHRFVRTVIMEMFGPVIANQMQILYGGSVKPNNAAELMQMSHIDGVLVGGASLDANDFQRILSSAQR